MKKIILLLSFILLSNITYSQSFFGDEGNYTGMELIYAGKFSQDGITAHVPTLSGAAYNPYGVTATCFYDSTGSCRIQLGTFSSSINVASAYLQPLAMSNKYGITSKVWAVSTSQVVTVQVFNKNGATYANGYKFTLLLYLIKP